MTQITGETVRLFLTTPNNHWILVLPQISLIGDLISMTIFYEGLDANGTWCGVDTLHNNQIMPNEQTLGYYMQNNSFGVVPHLEMEIKEV